MVRRDDDGTAADVDAYGEVDVWQSFNLGDNVVIEFATDVVVECDSDGHLGVGHQFTLARCEDQSDSFVV